MAWKQIAFYAALSVVPFVVAGIFLYSLYSVSGAQSPGRAFVAWAVGGFAVFALVGAVLALLTLLWLAIWIQLVVALSKMDDAQIESVTRVACAMNGCSLRTSVFDNFLEKFIAQARALRKGNGRTPPNWDDYLRSVATRMDH